jgi:hypothetical protein
MPILAFLAPFLNWIFRGIVIKFVLMTGLFALLTFLVPLVIGYMPSPVLMPGCGSSLISLRWVMVCR